MLQNAEQVQYALGARPQLVRLSLPVSKVFQFEIDQREATVECEVHQTLRNIAKRRSVPPFCVDLLSFLPVSSEPVSQPPDHGTARFTMVILVA